MSFWNPETYRVLDGSARGTSILILLPISIFILTWVFAHSLIGMPAPRRPTRAAAAQPEKQSDDELPSLDDLLRTSRPGRAVAKKGDTAHSSSTGGPKMNMNASAAKHRVRRLDGEPDGATDALMRPFDAERNVSAVVSAAPSRAMLLSRALLSEDEISPRTRALGATEVEETLRNVPPYCRRRSPSPAIAHGDVLKASKLPLRGSRTALDSATKTRESTKAAPVIRAWETIDSKEQNGLPTASGFQGPMTYGLESSENETSEEDTQDELPASDDDSFKYGDSDQSDSSDSFSLEDVHRRPRPSGSRDSRELSASRHELSKGGPDAFLELPRRMHEDRQRRRGTKREIQRGNGGAPKGRDSEQNTKSKPSRENLARETPDLAESFSLLTLPSEGSSDGHETTTEPADTTPCLLPGRDERTGGLTSPKKRAPIPQTPHRPSMDTFWDQDFMDDWNEQHSPRKLGPVKAPAKRPPAQKHKGESKKSFDARKVQIAEDFLAQLDSRITQGKLSALAAPTGGIKIVWSKTLNTTAGRANWKRETIRTKSKGGAAPEAPVEHRHHASIELAVKVIDEEDRLLNVLAHEFCHLANFMINGITNNPHGREFKAWAAQCSRAFAAQGIHVTTKHTYEIDFKYVWACEACGAQYKRHSKSIDPSRHRCGTCKGLLSQIKPVPRGAAAGAKPSEYQLFMKEHMKIVKSENPGSPQKEVMKIVADRWSRRAKAKADSEATKSGDMITQFVDLTLEAESEE